MFSLLFVYIIVIGYLGVTMYLANQEQLSDRHPTTTNALLYIGAGIIALMGFYAVLLALNAATLQQLAEQGEDVVVPEIGAASVVGVVLISGLASSAAYAAIRSQDARQQLRRVIGKQYTYNPGAIVHTTAVVLCLLLVTANTVLFLTSGGTSGMAESIDEQGVSLIEPIFQAFIQVAAAFLGIGYAIRRVLPQALDRLGLRSLTQQDVTRGILASLALYLLVIGFNVLIELLTQAGLLDSETLQEQTQAAESLANAFATPIAALILSASAAVGEEIFFRGALQPVFGNVLTSVVFAALHSQNLLSPSILLLFLVSLGLGTLRSRYNTNVAIIAHFLYNFIQLALLILAKSAGVI